MPFFDWSLLKSRTLHPDIGIPADDTQGLPYFAGFNPSPFQNYGLSAKAQSGTDSITGFLFTANARYLLGNGAANALNYTAGAPYSMFAIDSLKGHVYASTASGVINNPISISGNSLGWTGIQTLADLNCNPQITFFHDSVSKYVGFGNSNDGTFAIFTPGGIVKLYSGYAASNCLQPCDFYNGLYTILYGSYAAGSQYGFISLADAPEILPAFPSGNIISYSFTESAILFSFDGADIYGYNGINDPTLTSSFIKINFALNSDDVFGFDPVTHRLLSMSPNSVTVGGYAYYPVYVYDSVFVPSTPQQYARTVKNYTVNGHLNWRKQR